MSVKIHTDTISIYATLLLTSHGISNSHAPVE